MKIFSFTICLWVVSLIAIAQNPQIPAFPGAEGFGKYTTGGRGGKVIKVTNLEDDGPGSLREAIRADGPRTIVFEVSGNIVLKSHINVRNPHLTIAGQTAPGEGITISNYSLNFVNMHNVIVRFVRFRIGDTSGKQGNSGYGVYMDNAIFDHCTFSWGTDEIASFYGVRNFTMQWCIVSEALNNSIHEKGPHGYGGIIGGKNVSWHHNLLAHSTQRMIRFDHPGLYKSEQELIDWRGNTDFRNNVIYNWQKRSSEGGAEGNFNLINNYYKPGPGSASDARNHILNPLKTGTGETFDYGKFYMMGNFLAGNTQVSNNNWVGARLENSDLTEQFLESLKVFSAFSVPAGIYGFEETASESYEKVLQSAGASLYRDPIDTRIIHETKTGTYTFEGSKGSTGGIIDSQNDVGGWPVLQSLPAPKDTDRDGMPDTWETERGLNPNTYNPNGYNLDPNYTNLEVYLNGLVAHLMPGADKIGVNGVSITPTTLNLKVGDSYSLAHQVLPTNASNKSVTWVSTQNSVASVSANGIVKALQAGTSQIRVTTQDGNFSAVCQLNVESNIPVPSPPVLSSPASGASLPIGKTNFSWNAVSGAEKYRLQVSKEAQFNSPTYDVYNLPGTSVELDVKDQGTYYWRVSASNQGGSGTFSAASTFQTVAPPTPPALVSPNNQSLDLSASVLLSWAAVSNASSYRVQVATVQDFSQGLRDVSNISSTQLQLDNLSAGVTYYWRVRASNIAGNSSYSTVWEFSTKKPQTPPTTPVLSSPSSNSVVATGKVLFSWQGVSTANSYRLQVAKDAQFSSPIHDSSNLTNTSFELELLAAGTYFWRVSASNQAGSSDFSAARSFETLAPPSIPLLVSPNNQSLDLPNSLLLSWSEASNASSYRVQVATVRDFSQVLRDVSNLSTTQLQLDNLAEGITYYWRVRASNPVGNSNYSTTWEFSTKKALTVPTAPILSSPSNSSVLKKEPVQMQWQAVNTADDYQIQISLSSNFSQQILVNVQGISVTSFQFQDLAYNTVYFWRVRARNAAGYGPYSSIRSFKTEVEPQLAAAILRSPAKNGLIESDQVEFKWSAVPEATSYTLYLSQDSLFKSGQSILRSISDTSLLVSDLQRDKTYFWKIEALGTKKSSFSEVWKFSIEKEKETEVFQYRRVDINLYPNPATDFVNLSFSEFVSGKVLIQFLDSRGTLVLAREFENVGNELRWGFAGQNIPSGKYFLRIQGEWFVETKQVWIK